MIQYKYDLGEIVPGLTVRNRMPPQGPQETRYLVMQSDGRIRWLSERQVGQLVHFMTSTVALNDMVVVPEAVEVDPVTTKPKRGKK